jgi:hypothetical protein
MILQFIHTEADTPGPFSQIPGYKFKSVKVPSDVSITEDEARTLIQGSEAKLNSVLNGYVSYRAPELTVFMTEDELAAIPRDYVYALNDSNVFSFARLFTSGTNHGRPGNPFHQGFVFDREDLRPFIERVNSKAAGMKPRPADFSFSPHWATARGEVQVNAAEIPEAFPYPDFDGGELSFRHHAAFDSTANAPAVLFQYGQALYEGGDMTLGPQTKANFGAWVSLLTHLIPQVLAWRVQFTSLSAGRTVVGTNLPRIDIDNDLPTRTPDPSVVAWASLILDLIENYADSELTTLIDEVVDAFTAPPQQPGAPLSRSALLPALLAGLLLDDLFYSDKKIELADKAVNALGALGMPSSYRSDEAKVAILARIEGSELLIHQSGAAQGVLGLLKNIPVAN